MGSSVNTNEKIQSSHKLSKEHALCANMDSMTDEVYMNADKKAIKRRRTNGPPVPNHGALIKTHETQRLVSESTVKNSIAGVSRTVYDILKQDVQTATPSHGSRIAKLLLTTLLPQNLTRNLVISELPDELDADHMNNTYNMVSVPVPDGLSFRNRFTSLLQHLVAIHSSTKVEAEPIIFVFVPVENDSIKLITLVEKLKCDLKKCGVECFQYCAVRSRMVKVNLTPGVKRNRKTEIKDADGKPRSAVASSAVELEGQACDDNDEEEAFQTMDPSHDKLSLIASSNDEKLRRVPVMTIFLALDPVPELRKLYMLDSLLAHLQCVHLAD